MGKKYKSETAAIYFNDIPKDLVEQQKPLYLSKFDNYDGKVGREIRK